VGNEHDGLALSLPQEQQLFLQQTARLLIQCAEGLVHEQDLRLHRKRPGQADALLHAARELLWQAFLKAFEAD
jgi:hypothetical protein